MLNIGVGGNGISVLEGLGNDFEKIADAALDRPAQILLNAKIRQIQITYSRTIPTSKTGRALWNRVGLWLESQRIISTRFGERTITTVGKAADYEERLADLPTGAGGVNRTNKASENAVRIAEGQAVAAFEQEIQNMLNR